MWSQYSSVDDSPFECESDGNVALSLVSLGGVGGWVAVKVGEISA